MGEHGPGGHDDGGGNARPSARVDDGQPDREPPTVGETRASQPVRPFVAYAGPDVPGRRWQGYGSAWAWGWAIPSILLGSATGTAALWMAHADRYDPTGHGEWFKLASIFFPVLTLGAAAVGGALAIVSLATRSSRWVAWVALAVNVLAGTVPCAFR